MTIAGSLGYRSNEEGNLKLEIRKQKSEIRKRKAESRNWKVKQKAEIRNQKAVHSAFWFLVSIFTCKAAGFCFLLYLDCTPL